MAVSWFSFPTTLLLSTGLLFGAVKTSAASEPFNLEAYVAQQRINAKIPCLGVAVVRNGELLHKVISGKANLEWNNDCTWDSRFQLASATKLFTGLLLSRLQQQGLLNLTAPLSDVVKGGPEAFKRISVTHLASHTAGLPEPESIEMSNDVGLYLNWLQKNDKFTEPGQEARYGIGSYLLLRHVIEQVSQLSLEQALQKWVLSPMQLDSTSFDVFWQSGGLISRKIMPERVARYRYADGFQLAESEFPTAANPAGGLFSSLNDLIRFAKVIQAERDSHSGVWTDLRLNDNEPSGYGIGWTVRELKGQLATGHSGGPGLADFLYLPEQQLTVIVLSNSMDLYPYIAGQVARHYMGGVASESPSAEQDQSALGLWLLNTLQALSSGRIDDTLIDEAVKPYFVPAAVHYFTPMMQAFNKTERIELLPQKRAGHADKVYFKSVHGVESIIWSVKLNKEGKVVGFGPESP